MTTQNDETPVAPQDNANDQGGGAGGNQEALQLLGQIEQRLRTLEGRQSKLQSEADKRRQSSLERYAELSGAQLDPQVMAQLQMETLQAQVQALQERLGQQAQGPTATVPQGQPPVAPQPTRLDAVVQGLGLDPNSPAVLQAIAQYGSDDAALKIALVDIKVNTAIHREPNPAGAPTAPTGEAGPTDVSQDQLRQQFEAELKQIPFGQTRPQHWVATRDKYRRLGLEI